MTTTTFHAAMFPWFAFGHLLPFLHLANKLAKRGHRVSFLLPTKARTKLETFNFYPNLIHFVPLVVPHVDGLPPGAETMSDVPIHMGHLLMTAMARMQGQVEATLSDLKPDLIFLDTAHWIPALARRYGMKSIHHCIVGATSVAHHLVPARYFEKGKCTDLMLPPSGFPSSSLELHIFESRPMIEFLTRDYFDGMTFSELIMTSMKQCDAISFRTCRELEGPFCDYIESQHGKPVLLAGPTLPELPASPLEERWVKWLGGFKTSSVVYCALGSECVLKKEQFQELVLGLELTGLPFLAALTPPVGAATVEEALPKGFEERVRGRGVVHGGWVQQTLILGHPSVGCFVTHCGFSSTWESLMSDCQLVLLPHVADQFLNARLLSRELKVAVEVERREEDGWFTRKDVCKAVKLVMDDDSKVGSEMRENHGKWMEILLKPGFESSYIDSFVEKLQDLINSNKSDSGEWRPRLYHRPPVG